MEPADGKGLNYKLINKKPLEFYDQVLEQEVIKKKVFKDREQALQQSMQLGDPTHNMSKMSRMTRLQDVPLQYQETRGKRGVAVPYDECRRQIQEQNLRGSISPSNREASPNQQEHIEEYLAAIGGNNNNEY